MHIRLALSSAAHCLVDLACALLLLGRVCPVWDPARALLLYNGSAFALQLPLGLLADRLGRGRFFAASGCLLTAAAWLLPPGAGAVALAGLGNAAFHVGGGLEVLNDGGDRAGPLGLFVSPGALGLYLGGRWASAPGTMGPVVCVLLLFAATALALLGDGPKNAPLSLPGTSPRLWGAVACLLAVVILRSWMGLAAALPWKGELGFAAVLAVVLGKAAGGYLADRFGMLPTALASLGLSAICFLFAERAGAGLAALFLFNMTMPLTLWAVAQLLPGAKGFSFGLLTFGLFLGYLPFWSGGSGLGPAALCLGAALSLPPLLLGSLEAERRRGG